jgi:hypothetical protein
MLNYIKVTFPESSNQPKFIYSAYINHRKYEHEMATVTFTDWGIDYDDIKYGSPVFMEIIGDNAKRSFYGYVLHVNPQKSPGTNHTEVVIIGSSMVMKTPSQSVYTNITADKVIEQIARKHNFFAYTVPHARVYQQVSQAGHTDWELMVKLAKQCGYTLRTQNTEIYFQPMYEDYTTYRSEAPIYVMHNANDPKGTNIYSFKPLIGEHIDYEDAQKSAVSVAGVDRFNKEEVRVTKQKNKRSIRANKKEDPFDSFATHIVAVDPEIAKYESEAAEERNSFPYRATLEVIGSPTLRPDMPVYLEGLGTAYSGYWVVLNVEHKIVETERNRQTFTTILEVGSDSLGPINSWIDGNKILAPDAVPHRTIIPGVRSTVVRPISRLNINSLNVNSKTTSSFTAVKNKPKQKINNQNLQSSTWKTGTATIYSKTPDIKQPSFVINRLKTLGKR